MDIELSTGQHTWDSYKARDEKPKPDVELSRKAHGLRIEVPDLCRRVSAASIWIELLLESLTQDQGGFATKGLIVQWLENMKIQAKMAKLDMEFIAKRIDNQVGAVSDSFSLRLPSCSSLEYHLKCDRYITDFHNETISLCRRSPRPPIVTLLP